MFQQDFFQVWKETRMLSESEKRYLLQAARCSIDAALNGTWVYTPEDVPESLTKPCGAFVTLRIGEELRGCIGYIESANSLIDTVQDAAAKAALEDVRFLPVMSNELPKISIEISILSPVQQIESIEQIEVGTHGLIVEYGHFRGLLLPQVATEHGWDRETFVSQTCRKAGLPPTIWKNPQVKIYTFTAEIFHEESMMESNEPD